MRKYALCFTLLSMLLGFTKCKSDSSSKGPTIKSNSIIDTSLNNLKNFVDRFSNKKNTKDQFKADNVLDYEVPSNQIQDVESCYKAYLVGLKNHNYDTSISVSQPITRSISFGSGNLIKWLNEVTINGTTTTDIHVTFALYTKQYLHGIDPTNPTKYDKVYLGRFGAFLWAKDVNNQYAHDASGNTLNGYDLGGLHP